MLKRTTQADIAAKLGLTKATVSLALSNDNRISAPTRERVRRVPKELGYRPDPMRSMLARARWAGRERGCLLYLLDRRSPDSCQLRRYFPGARAQAELCGYRLEAYDMGSVHRAGAVARIMRHRGIRGALVPQLGYGNDLSIHEMDTSTLTLVGLGLGWERLPHYAVVPDTFAATLRAWTEAKARGYLRIGGALGSRRSRAFADTMLHGASLAAQRLLPAKERLLLWTDDLHNRGSFLRWMKEVRPDVVIGYGHIVQPWLLEAGWRIPEDVAICSLEVDENTRQLTGVGCMDAQIGASGVDLLVSAIRDNESGRPKQPHSLVLPVDWVEGTTLPARPRRVRAGDAVGRGGTE